MGLGSHSKMVLKLVDFQVKLYATITSVVPVAPATWTRTQPSRSARATAALGQDTGGPVGVAMSKSWPRGREDSTAPGRLGWWAGGAWGLRLEREGRGEPCVEFSKKVPAPGWVRATRNSSRRFAYVGLSLGIDSQVRACGGAEPSPSCGFIFYPEGDNTRAAYLPGPLA